mgnify:CR=1 FL=1
MKLWKNFYQPPTLKITREVDEKIRQLVKLTDTEIAWHGFLQYDINTDTYTLYDIVLFPQIVTSVTVQTDDDKYAVMKNGRKTAIRVFDSEAEANEKLSELKGDFVEHRPAISRKCSDYCSCCEFCNFYKNNVAK